MRRGEIVRPEIRPAPEALALAELRRERDRLLQLAAAGEALPTILHEIKNPLAGVMTAVEVLVEELPEGDVRDQLHAVLGELRRVVTTLRGIGTAGQALRSPRPGAVDEAVRDSCRVLERSAAAAGVVLTTEVPWLPLLPFDPAVVRGITFNLVSNAIEACREGGGQVTVSAMLSPRTLRLTVEDTGKGMSPEVLLRCTELFFTTRPGGNGIGLHLCRRTVEGAGGRFNVESAPGRGTTVALEVPLRDERE